MAYHTCVGVAGKYYPESFNSLLARRGGFEVILGKNNALEGGPSPKSNVGRKGVTLNIPVLENNVEFT